jgi:hypothetical protein
MDVVYTHCRGLDVHQKTVVACLIPSTERLEPVKELRLFRTMTADLLALADWLQQAGCTHVAMESTGVSWRVEIAQVASKTQNTSLAAQYRRIAARRGKKRALIAVGHTILTIVYTLLTRQQPHQDLGAAYFDQREHHRVERRLMQRLERLGYQVSLQPRALAS